MSTSHSLDAGTTDSGGTRPRSDTSAFRPLRSCPPVQAEPDPDACAAGEEPSADTAEVRELSAGMTAMVAVFTLHERRDAIERLLRGPASGPELAPGSGLRLVPTSARPLTPPTSPPTTPSSTGTPS